MRRIPVIIPTLNRINHLKNCINSLASCKGVKYVTLYIGLDFPPAEKYVNGYDKVCNYLIEDLHLDLESTDFQGSNVFEAIKILKASKNLGPFENSDVLINEVKKDGFDSYIFTEDDNVFSEDFLEYIVLGLEQFKNDDYMFAVCGYMWPVNFSSVKSKSATAICVNSISSAWGYGIWIDKVDKMRNDLSVNYLEKIAKNRKIMKRLRSENPFIYSEFVKGYLEYSGCLIENGKVNLIDLFYSVWSFVNDCGTVYPLKSLVRNGGNDGTGENCEVLVYDDSMERSNRNFDYSKQNVGSFDTSSNGIVLVDNFEYANCLKKLNGFFEVSAKELFRVDVSLFLSRILGRDIVKNLLKIVR